MRLTKKKAIELSIEKWTDLAETGDEGIEDWHTEEFKADCALCEYDQRHLGWCSSCPYQYRFTFCILWESPYEKWANARTTTGRKKYASEFLAQLKELGL